VSRRAWRVTASLVAILVAVLDLIAAGAPRPADAGRPAGPVLVLDAVIGGRYVLLVAGLVLLALARPLRQGKRVAWWGALLTALASLPAHVVKQPQVLGVLAPAVLAVLLGVGRRAFRAASDPLRARTGALILIGGSGIVLIYGTIGLYLLDAEFREATTLSGSFTEAARLLFLLPAATIEPVSRHGVFFLDSVRVASLVVILVGVSLLVATVVLRRGQDPVERAEVEHLLQEYATGSLAYFLLLEDKRWCFSPDRGAVVGYHLQGPVAVALGEPIGAPDELIPCARAFVDLCEAQGWIPAWHQVSEPGREILDAVGQQTMKIGEEAVIDVASFSLDGRKSLRSALRRVQRAGLRVVELPQPIDDETMAQLRDVSDAWLSHGGHRERTFSLGRFDPAYLRATRVLAAVDANGAIAAFANLLPAYRSSVGNFDLMRRDPGSPNGTMDALFVAMIERCRAEGLQGLSLGLAPLTGISGDTLRARALRLLYDRAGRFFNFEGLRRFKDKWEPRWEPRYLGYPSDVDLPRVAAAVARAGELPDPRPRSERILATARRWPFTIALFAIAVWLMAVTAVDPASHAWLLRHLGLGWNDLVRLQWWRLPTSQLLQAKSGFVWSNVALLGVVVPIGEALLGTRLVVALFFLGDWISTLLVMLGARLLVALGAGPAVQAALGRDCGSSSGAWAIALGVTWALPRSRTRTTLLACELGFLIGVLVLFGRLFDVQHLIAGLAGIAITEVWTRRKAQAHANAATGIGAPAQHSLTSQLG
jgi:phosphatidylglycerol lysyltransferase